MRFSFEQSRTFRHVVASGIGGHARAWAGPRGVLKNHQGKFAPGCMRCQPGGANDPVDR